MEPSTDDLLEAIRKMKETHPDWRIGQLVANVAHWSRGATHEAVWDIEDAEFVEAVQNHLKETR